MSFLQLFSENPRIIEFDDNPMRAYSIIKQLHPKLHNRFSCKSLPPPPPTFTVMTIKKIDFKLWRSCQKVANTEKAFRRIDKTFTRLRCKKVKTKLIGNDKKLSELRLWENFKHKRWHVVTINGNSLQPFGVKA